MQSATVGLDLPIKVQCPAKGGTLVNQSGGAQIGVFQREVDIQGRFGGVTRTDRSSLAIGIQRSASRNRGGERERHSGGGRDVADDQMDILIRALCASRIAAAMTDV